MFSLGSGQSIPKPIIQIIEFADYLSRRSLGLATSDVLKISLYSKLFPKKLILHTISWTVPNFDIGRLIVAREQVLFAFNPKKNHCWTRTFHALAAVFGILLNTVAPCTSKSEERELKANRFLYCFSSRFFDFRKHSLQMTVSLILF